MHVYLLCVVSLYTHLWLFVFSMCNDINMAICKGSYFSSFVYCSCTQLDDLQLCYTGVLLALHVHLFYDIAMLYCNAGSRFSCILHNCTSFINTADIQVLDQCNLLLIRMALV